ncbi:hypothetical protein DB313_05330 (plasmid) [Borrelia turcica IST7]|uniref:Uncharacterized protein n=1 Tax=Borrelia turcica IST7 TaxID=1104446 RepID=A0A386PNT3_9SPIR|nr:hypothetical protein [Borrelia turcica]AYE36922.1 hypothetical protein DB313_05330 [Borrelia turcica IST7]
MVLEGYVNKSIMVLIGYRTRLKLNEHCKDSNKNSYKDLLLANLTSINNDEQKIQIRTTSYLQNKIILFSKNPQLLTISEEQPTLNDFVKERSNDMETKYRQNT